MAKKAKKGRKRPSSRRPPRSKPKPKASTIPPPPPATALTGPVQSPPGLEPLSFPQFADPKKRAFLSAYSMLGVVTRAAIAAGVDQRTHRNWMKSEDDEYRAAFEMAKDHAADALELEAVRRAREGLVRYQFTRDGTPLVHPITGQPYYEIEYSDTLLIFLLKGVRPEKFRDRAVEVAASGREVQFRVVYDDAPAVPGEP